MRIYKYEIPVDVAPTKITMQAGARFVHAETRGPSVFLWFEIYDVSAHVERAFAVFPTGMKTQGQHIATAATPDLKLVWHVYELETV